MPRISKQPALSPHLPPRSHRTNSGSSSASASTPYPQLRAAATRHSIAPTHIHTYTHAGASSTGVASYSPQPFPSPPVDDGDGKYKRRRSALPAFAVAAAVAAVLLLLLLAGLYLPPGAPLIVMPHPPTLALLRDSAADTSTTTPQPASALDSAPAVGTQGAVDSAAERTNSAHRLKQRVSEQQAALQPRADTIPLLQSTSPFASLTSAAGSPSHERPRQQPLTLPLSASALATVPLLLTPYYARNLSSAASFHNSFYSEPYMRDRGTPTSDRSLLASNRALPHTFPSPMAFAPSLLSSSVVVGVFCYDVARIEVLLDTWGKWLLPARLLIFSERSSYPAAQLRQLSLPSVIVMDNEANAHRNVTDRRASAWKILPAVRLLHARHPDAPWYYLCDDDSFPLVPNLAHFTANFYSQHAPRHTPQHALYVGESVLQQTFHKGYYADEKVRSASDSTLQAGRGLPTSNTLVLGCAWRVVRVGSAPCGPRPALGPSLSLTARCAALLPLLLVPPPVVQGLQVDLRYHCTGGGVLLNQRLMSLLAPHVDRCFVFFASDLSLGHCIQQQVRNVTMLEIPDATHMFSRTMEEVVSKFGLKESVVWQAGAFHHMREPFIAKWGVDSRLEVYLRESEMRGFASYLWTLAEMAKEEEADAAAGRDVAARGVVRGSGRDEGQRKLRVLLALRGETSDAVTDVSSMVAAMLRSDGWQPLSFLASLSLDTDVLLLDAAQLPACSHCDVYGPSRERCLQLLAEQSASLLQHAQAAPLNASIARLRVREMRYEPYDLVLTRDAILSPSEPAHALYAHATHPACSIARSTALSPYSLALVSELSLLDELHSATSFAAPDAVSTAGETMPFPSLSLFYGLYHSLRLSEAAYLHAERASTLLLLLGDESRQASSLLSLQAARLRVSPLPVAPLSLSAIAKLSSAKLCVFAPQLTSGTNSSSAGATERRLVVQLALSAIAAGCLCVVSDEVARWGLSGERVESSGAEGAVSGLGVLLGGAAVVSDIAALRSFVERVQQAGSREYGVELAYQRTALNSHLMEKPWHALLAKLKQHRERLETTAAAALSDDTSKR